MSKKIIGALTISAAVGMGLLAENQNNEKKMPIQNIFDGFLERVTLIYDTKGQIQKYKIQAENIKSETKSQEVVASIDFIIKKLGDKNQKNDELYLYKVQLDNLKQISDIYNAYLETPYTKETNDKLRKYFSEIFSLVQKGDKFDTLLRDIRITINNEHSQLEDTSFLIENFTNIKTVRDYVEQYIDIKNSLIFDTYNETVDIGYFLELFTIEYINLKGDVNVQKNNLDIGESQLDTILQKVSSRAKNIDKKFDFPVKFLIAGGKKIERNVRANPDIEKLTFPAENIDFSENKVIVSSNPDIRKAQKKYGLEHRNITKDNYGVQTKRVVPFHASPKGQMFHRFLTEQDALNAKEQGKLVDIRSVKNPKFIIDASLYVLESKMLVGRDTLHFIKNTSEEFYAKTGKKLKITSLVRTKAVNNSLPNSSPNSSHNFSNAVDFGVGNMSLADRKVLEQILIQADTNAQIIFISELQSQHFHASVIQTSQIMKSNFPEYNKFDPDAPKKNISEYLAEKGDIDITTKMILQDIFYKSELDYMKFNREQRILMQKNLITFINYILYIESSGGQYIRNSEGSTADGPFQYITGYEKGKDGKPRRRPEYRGENQFTSFEVALRTYIKYANNSQIPNSKDIGHPDWVQIVLDSQGKYGPNTLSPEQNINLFLVGTFLGDSKKKAEQLMTVLMGGPNAKKEMEDLYVQHHTNPDKKTREKMAKGMRIFGSSLKNID